MVSALFITIYVELGAQPVGFTTWSGKSNNPKVARVWVIDMIWQLYLVFRDRLSQAVRSTPKYDEHSHFFFVTFFHSQSCPRLLHKCSPEKNGEMYKHAHHRGCAIPFGPRHINPGRAEQV